MAREREASQALALTSGPRGTEFWPLVRATFHPAPPPPPPLQDGVANGESPAVEPKERVEIFGRHLRTALGGASDPSFDEALNEETEELMSLDPLLRPLPKLPLAETVESPPSVASEPIGLNSNGLPAEQSPTRPVSWAEVELAVKMQRRGKAPGPDGVAVAFLKEAPIVLYYILAQLFTASLALGSVPGCWKQSVVRMLPKPGKPLTRAVDYRPISLSSVIGKLLEGIFARRLQGVCSARSLLPPEQSGFQPKRGALEQVLLLAQRAGQAMNSGLTTAVVALDIAKAYDSVWHAGLLRICREHLPLESARWIAAFLTDRRVAVLESGFVSSDFSPRAGVPQGSPLSPLLYILFTRELPVPRGRLRGATVYADDVALWSAGTSPLSAWTDLASSLDAVALWCRRWRLRVSPEKTQLTFFSRRNGGWSEDQLAPVTFLGRPLLWAPHLDLLGVRLDRRLQMRAHAQWLVERTAPRAVALRKLMGISRRIPAWIGSLLYKVMVRSALAYAAPILMLANSSAWLLLQRVERRCLRAALRCRADTRIAELHRRSRVPPLQAELRRHTTAFLRRLVEAGNDRVLSAFQPESPQRPGVVRWDTPLERAYALLDDQERAEVVSWVRSNLQPSLSASLIPAIGRLYARRSQGTSRPPLHWGRSPIDDAVGLTPVVDEPPPVRVDAIGDIPGRPPDRSVATAIGLPSRAVSVDSAAPSSSPGSSSTDTRRFSRSRNPPSSGPTADASSGATSAAEATDTTHHVAFLADGRSERSHPVAVDSGGLVKLTSRPLVCTNPLLFELYWRFCRSYCPSLYTFVPHFLLLIYLTVLCREKAFASYGFQYISCPLFYNYIGAFAAALSLYCTLLYPTLYC